MHSFESQKLWHDFLAFIAKTPPPSSDLASASFEDVMERVNDFIADSPPDNFKVLDAEIYSRGRRSLTADSIRQLAAHLSAENDEEVPESKAFSLAAEQFAVLSPVELLSFPYPEARARLVARFGLNSVFDGLKDLYDLDSSPLVREAIVEALHARITWRDVPGPEHGDIIDFAAIVLRDGYYDGRELTAAQSAHQVLRATSPDCIPTPLRQLAIPDWRAPRLDFIKDVDRLGIVRIIGPVIHSVPLLRLAEQERNPAVFERLLILCDARWRHGFLPPDEVADYTCPQDFWREVAGVMLGRLGIPIGEAESHRFMLGHDPHPGESTTLLLLRKLALTALHEGY